MAEVDNLSADWDLAFAGMESEIRAEEMEKAANQK